MEVLVEVYGAVAVAAMVLFYALETRSRRYVLAFAVACVAASSYAALIGSWPFATIELIWGGIAARRWQIAKEVP